MITINRELFEAWLFSQPREREFVYVNGLSHEEPGCVVCSFLREATDRKQFGVASNFIELREPYQYLEFPGWLSQLDLVTIPPTFGAVQDRYLQLFPNTLDLSKSQTEAPSEPVAKELGTSLNQVVSSQKCD